MTVAEVEKGLGRSVDTVVDRDTSLISESMNLGRPAVLLKKSSFERSLTDLGARITGNDQSDAQRVGLLRALLRPFRSNGSAAATTETK